MSSGPIFKVPQAPVARNRGLPKMSKPTESEHVDSQPYCENECGNLAEVYCAACDFTACSDCSTTAHRIAKFKSHDVVPLDQMCAHPEMICSIHKKVLGTHDVYCTTCGEICCSLCLALKDCDKHSEHEVITIAACKGWSEYILNEVSQDLESNHGLWQTTIDHAQIQLEENLNSVRRQIEQRHEELVQTLGKRKLQMLDAVAKKHKKSATSLDCIREPYAALQTQLATLQTKFDAAHSAFAIAEIRKDISDFKDTVSSFALPSTATEGCIPPAWREVADEEGSDDNLLWDLLRQGVQSEAVGEAQAQHQAEMERSAEVHENHQPPTAGEDGAENVSEEAEEEEEEEEEEEADSAESDSASEGERPVISPHVSKLHSATDRATQEVEP